MPSLGLIVLMGLAGWVGLTELVGLIRFVGLIGLIGFISGGALRKANSAPAVHHKQPPSQGAFPHSPPLHRH